MNGPEHGSGVRVGIASGVHGTTTGLATALERMGPVDELPGSVGQVRSGTGGSEP